MTPGQHRGPAITPADARLPTPAPVQRHWPATDRRRILLCDGESQSLHALRVVLRGAGFEVDPTRTIAEALDRGALRAPCRRDRRARAPRRRRRRALPAPARVERDAGAPAIGRVR